MRGTGFTGGGGGGIVLRSRSRRGLVLVTMLTSCATRTRGFVPRMILPDLPAGQWTRHHRHALAGAERRRWTSTDTRHNPGGDSASGSSGGGSSRGNSGSGLRRMAAVMKAGLDPGKGTQVVLLRHGMSTFNKLNIFTGWCDVPLAEEGKAEAIEAGKLLAAAGFRFDVAHASVLKRACTSLHRLLDGCNQPYIPVKTTWRLNERHYGALQGRNKATLEEAMGPIVVEWRRGYNMRPPPMVDTHPHWPLISLDSRYRGVKIPESESLSDTADRVMEYWNAEIVPDIKAGKRVIVVAHANTLRSLVKRLDDVEDDAIRDVSIPTGEPFVYEFDADLRPMGEPNEVGFRGRFVGDMMKEKTAAVDEYKRKEQACIDKWESNPELVPEECMCTEDLDFDRLDPSSPLAKRFGEDQASLGLDRYSVGFDLPAQAAPPARQQQQDVGAPVLETLYGISELPGAPVGAGEPTVPMTAAVLDIADTEAGEVLIGEDGEREDNSGRAVNGAGAGGGGEKLAKEEAREERNEPLPDPVA